MDTLPKTRQEKKKNQKEKGIRIFSQKHVRSVENLKK